MIKRKPRKKWIIFAIVVLALVLTIKFLGQIFFFNFTSSMTKGLYVKIPIGNLEAGDIIVFKSKFYDGLLIKFVAGVYKDKYYFDEAGTLFINKFPVALRNWAKYPDVKLNTGCFE